MNKFIYKSCTHSFLISAKVGDTMEAHHVFKLALLLIAAKGLTAKSIAFPVNSVNNRIAELTGVNRDSSKEECAENYFPCICEIDLVYGVSVSCTNVFDPQVVQDVFNQTLAEEIGSFTLSTFIFPTIPSDFLSGKRATRIVLRSGTNRLTIDADAFQSTANYTQIFDIVYMADLSNLNFGFLSGFDELQSIGMFGNSYGVAASIPSLPPLANLKELIIAQSDLYRVGSDFPNLTPARLQRLWLFGNKLDDVSAEAILDNVLASTAGSTLVQLVLNDNLLTKVPQTTRLFPQLQYLDVQHNKITEIMTGSLTFVAPVLTVEMSNNPIENKFQAGAFQGDFSNAKVSIQAVSMTTLAPEVFQRVLEQMVQPGNRGSIILTYNFFECDCSLAWLMRDNRHLLAVVENAFCSSGSLFQNTNPDQFQNCV